MKHLKWIALLLAAILLIGMPLALAEDDDDDDDDYGCSHSWVYDYERDATCTQSGKIYYRCVYCGDSYSERTRSALGHKWGSWTVTAEPTCSSPGSRVHKCSRCGKKETQKIAALPHDFGDWSIILEATDHSSGVRMHVCRACGFEETLDYDPDGTLRKKDKGEAVKELQSMLFCRGLLPEKRINGNFDSTTEKAVKKLQEAEGLTVDGVAWPQTIGRLGHHYGPWTVLSVKSDFSIGIKQRTCALCGYTTTVEDAPSPLLKKGSKGDEVKALQQALNDAGYNCGRVDGDYGGKTERAIKAFEKDKELEEDGIAWPGVIKLIPNLELAGDDVCDLSLVVTQVSSAKDAYRDGETITVEWTLVNQGGVDCKYWRIDYREGASSQSESLLTAGTLSLKAGGGNARSGKCEMILRADAANPQTSAIVYRATGVDANDSELESEEYALQFNME